MNYIEYNEENIDLKNLEADFITKEDYSNVHKNSIIVCHDVFIKCKYDNKEGILLVKRLNEPAKNVFWPLGGRILRGMPTEVSLTQKAKAECNLSIHNIKYVGTARTYFGKEPFGHGKGTDTINLMYIADGEGEVSLDSLHDSPYILTRESFTLGTVPLPKYVHDFLSEIMKKGLW